MNNRFTDSLRLTQPSGDTERVERKLCLLFFASVFLAYLAFSPATIEGVGYYGENLTAANQVTTNVINLLHSQPLVQVTWTRHGGLELVFELPFVFFSRLVFGDSIKWAGRVLAVQPVLATALSITLVFVWVRRLTGSWRWPYALTLIAAFATMLWPYAYIGLETTQSLCLLVAGYLALGRPSRRRWLEVIFFAGCCVSALTVKTTGLFLLPALAYLTFCYFTSGAINRRVAKFAVLSGITATIFSLNFYLKEIYWARNPGGSKGFLASLLVDDALVFLAQAFSFFGSANKSLLIYAPVVVLCLARLPQAYRRQPRLVIFALLVLSGLVGGFSLVTVWTEETWGPRYLHSAIAPLVICLGVTQLNTSDSWQRRLALPAAAALGLLVTLPGVVIAYTQLHQAATRSGRATLAALQYDPAFNHVRFNYQLLRIWATTKDSVASQPILWPPPPAWWFEKPTDAAPERSVDLREWAIPQPALLRQWTSAMSIAPRQHFVLRLLLGVCLAASFLLFTWQYRLIRSRARNLRVRVVKEESTATLSKFATTDMDEKQRIPDVTSELSGSQQNTLSGKNEQSDAQTIALLKNQLALSEASSQELQKQLNAILTSRGWQVMQKLWQVRRKLAPAGSRRLKLLYAGAKLVSSAGKLVPTGTKTEDDNYREWIAAFEPDGLELQKQRDLSSQFAYQPLISIITPVYNTPPELLQAMIQSVQDQTYSRWQLCLVDGNSPSAATWESLCRWAESDDRITVKRLPENRGISGNSNAALEMAQGEFIALLDHDDLLAPNALFEVAKLLNQQPVVDFIYSDRDFISEDGSRRFEPIFKPDWSPEVLMSANYLCHLTVIRRSLIAKIGGFDSALDGAQDWDFFLRLTEATEGVAHIPKVLYHWRQWGNSSASSVVAKPYVLVSQKRAICAALQRKGLEAKADFTGEGHLRVTWPLPSEPKISVVIKSHGSFQGLQTCLASLLQETAYHNFEVLVVREELNDRQAEQITKHTGKNSVSVIRLNADAGDNDRKNLVLANTTGGYFLFLNDALTVIAPDWMEEMVRWILFPGVGIVGAKLLGPDYKIRHAGIVLGRKGEAFYPFAGLKESEKTIFGYPEWYRNWSAVSGDCLLISRTSFQDVGNDVSTHHTAEDGTALCSSVSKSGLRVLYTPYARLKYHSAAALVTNRATEINDPFYSCNLSPVSTIPQFRKCAE